MNHKGHDCVSEGQRSTSAATFDFRDELVRIGR